MIDEKKDQEDREDREEGKDACEKCEESLSGWKRALADYDNLKKDLAKERGDIRRNAAQHTAFQLLPVLDNFDQALKFKPEGLDGKTEGWLQGILHVRTGFESVLRELGLEPFGEVGDLFDPHRYEAGGERVEKEQVSGTVLEIIQRGWKQNDVVFRPAKVIICK